MKKTNCPECSQEMTIENFIEYHAPETAEEKAACIEAFKTCGDFPECAKCSQKVIWCELLSIQYESNMQN